jgi:hypothetical protein
MNLTELLALGFRVIELALRSGEDFAVVIKIAQNMQEVAKSDTQPTAAQFAELQNMVEPYLQILNDTERDDA